MGIRSIGSHPPRADKRDPVPRSPSRSPGQWNEWQLLTAGDKSLREQHPQTAFNALEINNSIFTSRDHQEVIRT